jgi:Copper amine oxidase N-terminal domain.
MALFAVNAYADQKISISINGVNTNLDARMINDSVYVPARAFSEALGAEIDWNEDYKAASVYADIKMIASLPDEKTYLYALNKDGNMYNGLILSINGTKKAFDWKTISLTEDLPKLQYVDLNDDDDKELIIFLSQGHGTGSVRKDIHILNPNNFSEYNMEDPVNAVKNNVKINMLSNKEVEIDIKDKIYKINIDDIQYGAGSKDIKNISYDDFVDYEIVNGKVKATIGIEGDYLHYLGYVEIEYSYNNGKFEASKLWLQTIALKR